MTAALPTTGHDVDDATLRRLILRIDPARISALILDRESTEHEVVFITDELAANGVKALENAVYDNPLLLGDFSAVDVIFSTPELLTAPAGIVELREAMAEAMLPDSECARTVLASAFGNVGEVIYAVDTDIYNFVARTFACARFHHSLAIDCARLCSLEERCGRLYALNEGNGEINIVAFARNGSLRYLNRPQPHGATDCAYHILAAAESADTLTLGDTDRERREIIGDTIAKMRPGTRLLPLTLPENMLYLRRMAPQATFDMIFLTQNDENNSR